MKIAVSNIAWPETDRMQAYAALAARGVQGLEIAPGLFFAGADDPFVPDAGLAQDRLSEIAAHALRLVSMQSLLFGVEGAALFEGASALERFETGMNRAIDLAARFAIPNLVFGSPKQRIVPEGMAPEAARDHAAEVFRDLGAGAVSAGTVIAIEANPHQYGTNFLTRAEEALAFVRHVDHPGVRMILDVGAMHLNAAFDHTGAIIAEAAPLLSHVHISEPFLAPAPARRAEAESVLQALAAVGYDKWVSIEMKASAADPVPTMTSALDRLLRAKQAIRETGSVSP
jgi:sugar phosphate isomerase/epimerase